MREERLAWVEGCVQFKQMAMKSVVRALVMEVKVGLGFGLH